MTELAEDEGLRVVLSPVQLAAMLAGADITTHATVSNRLWGGARALGGALEVIAGGALVLTPEPTGLTKAGGYVLGAHGADTFSTGMRQVWTGRPAKSLTEQAGAAAARGLGASAEKAERAGEIIDIAVPIVVASVAAALRVMSVRAGRIALAEHEAPVIAGGGGHTILKHVGKTEAELRARLVAESRIPRASSFPSLRVAESVLSDAIQARGHLIRAWARTASSGDRYDWVYRVGKDIGYGVIRKTGQLVQMQNVQIVLQRTQIGGKLYYILTAYPVP